MTPLLGLALTGLVTVGLFVLLRRMERWLHQHMFKVGWLVTHNFQTTTILYYTFFLPGIVVHEVIYWLAAGVLNVRADRAIQWPEVQEIGELKLNFVKLAPRADIYRKAIISAIPLLAGLLILWHAAHNVFNVDAALETMSTGELVDVSAGFAQLTTAVDFWLWFYLVFTIGNTMFPANPGDLTGWRNILGVVGVLIVIAIIFIPNSALLENVIEPGYAFLNEVQIILLLIMGVNLFMVLLLGLIEYIIEHATGHSVTFRAGKMITMTRAEAQAAREEERERERRRQERQRQRRVTAPITSIYALELPVPDVPGKEPVTQPEIGPVIIAGGEVQEVAPPLTGQEEREERREPVFNPGNRPAEPVQTPPPVAENDDEDLVEEAVSIARRESISRPPAQPDEVDDQSIDEPESDTAFTPTTIQRPSLRRPVVAPVDDEEESVEEDNDDHEERSTFVRPSITPAPSFSRSRPSLSEQPEEDDLDEDDTDENDERRSAFVRPSITPTPSFSRSRPSLSEDPDDEDDTDESNDQHLHDEDDLKTLTDTEKRRTPLSICTTFYHAGTLVLALTTFSL